MSSSGNCFRLFVEDFTWDYLLSVDSCSRGTAFLSREPRRTRHTSTAIRAGIVFDSSVHVNSISHIKQRSKWPTQSSLVSSGRVLTRSHLNQPDDPGSIDDPDPRQPRNKKPVVIGAQFRPRMLPPMPNPPLILRPQLVSTQVRRATSPRVSYL